MFLIILFIGGMYFGVNVYAKSVICVKNYSLYNELYSQKNIKIAWYLESFNLMDGTLLAIIENKEDLLKVKFREYMTKEEFLEFYINLFDYYNNGYC